MSPTRTRLVLLAVATLALIGGLLMLVARSANKNDAAAVVEEVGASGRSPAFKGAIRPKGPPHDFALRNQDGRLISTKTLRGKVIVISPMYTTCQDTCPLVAQQIRDSLRDLAKPQRKQVVALAISVDPAGDTRESANRFLDTRRVRGFIDFLIGSRPELLPVWRAYGFSQQLERREHNSYVVLLDRSGRQRVGFPVDYMTPEALTHDISVLVDEPS